jgi:hypothetical protein
VDNRNIVMSPAFRPAWVFTKPDLVRNGLYRFQSMLGDLSFRPVGGNNTTNGIQALNSDGFQLGTDNQVNSSTATYYYWAFRSATWPQVLIRTGKTIFKRAKTIFRGR